MDYLDEIFEEAIYTQKEIQDEKANLQNPNKSFQSDEEFEYENLEIKVNQPNDDKFKITSNSIILTQEFLIFIEIYINSLIYLRGVYPSEIFQQQHNLYNLDVIKIVKEKEISNYIKEFINSLAKLLSSHKVVKAIYLMIYDQERNEVIESYKLNTQLRENILNMNSNDNFFLFRSFIYSMHLNLGNCRRKANKSFKLAIETTECEIVNDSKILEEVENEIRTSWIGMSSIKNDRNSTVVRSGQDEHFSGEKSMSFYDNPNVKLQLRWKTRI